MYTRFIRSPPGGGFELHETRLHRDYSPTIDELSEEFDLPVLEDHERARSRATLSSLMENCKQEVLHLVRMDADLPYLSWNHWPATAERRDFNDPGVQASVRCPTVVGNSATSSRLLASPGGLTVVLKINALGSRNT